MLTRDRRKTFMLIGVSRPSLPIIDMARAIGFEVVATDINPAAAGLQCGDHNYTVSARDVQSLTRIALRHDVACVYSGTDINFTVGVINKALHLPGFPLVLGLASEYKTIFRQLAAQAHLPLTRAHVVRTKEEAARAYSELGGRHAVLKAIDLSSSLGIRKIDSPQDLDAAFEECQGLSNENEYILEEFVDGTCHDVNGLVIAGRFYRCGIVDRSFVRDSQYFVQKEATCPTALDEHTQYQLYDTMATFSDFLGIETSPVKADFLYDGRQPYLLEFAPRFHGEMGFLHMIPGALGIGAMEAYLQYRYCGELDPHLLVQSIVDTAVCSAETTSNLKSNYDVAKYTISFGRRQDIEVSIR